MKRKFFTTMFAFLALAITACGGAGSQTPASQELPWEHNNTNHWHVNAEGEKIDNAKHELEEDPAQAVAATCEQDGKKVEVCKVCGFVKESKINALGHDWDNGEVTKEATCSVPGERTFKCKREGCNATKVEPITAEHDLQPVAHTQGEGEVAETVKKCSKDAYYQIEWRADDAAAELNNTSDRKSDGYVKLSKQVAADGTGTASYIIWKIWSPVAMKGRFWIDITGNTSNVWTRDNTSGAQALYYTYNDTTTNINTWKNKVELNDVEVDFENATYPIGEENVKFAELTYSDFGELASAGGATISVPMPEVNLQEGVNTLKFTRLTGYAFNMHSFTFKASIQLTTIKKEWELSFDSSFSYI